MKRKFSYQYYFGLFIVILSTLHCSSAFSNQELEIEGSVGSLLFTSDNKYLVVSTGPYGQDDVKSIENYGITVFTTAANQELKKIGFLPIGIGKGIGLDEDLLIVHRKKLPTSFESIKEKYPPSIILVSLKNPKKPSIVGKVQIEAYYSAISTERKLVAASNGQNLEFVSYESADKPKVLARFKSFDSCKSPYGGSKIKIGNLAFSNEGNELHLLVNDNTLCSYDISSVAKPVLLRGGLVHFGTKIIPGKKLIILLGGGSAFGNTHVYRNLAGEAYELGDYYEVINNFELDDYQHSETYSFRHYQILNNKLFVNAGIYKKKPYRYQIYDISNRNNPLLLEEYPNPNEYSVTTLAISPDTKFMVAGLNKRIKKISLLEENIASPDELGTAYQAASNIFSQSPDKNGAVKAIEVLSTHNIDKIKNNRYPSISENLQAKLVSDYGFYLYLSGKEQEGLDYLNSALKYDYDLALVHQRLGNLYTNKLADSDGLDKQVILGKIRTHCSYFQDHIKGSGDCGGDIYSNISLERADSEVCEYVQKAANAKHLKDIINNESELDVNGDGVVDIAQKSINGTALFEEINIFNREKELMFTSESDIDRNSSVAYSQDIFPFQGYYYFLFWTYSTQQPVRVVRANTGFSGTIVCGDFNGIQ